jgi:transposase
LQSVVSGLADGGYAGEDFADEMPGAPAAPVQIAKRDELHRFEVLPKRWIMERSFARLEKCRRLWKKHVRVARPHRLRPHRPWTRARRGLPAQAVAPRRVSVGRHRPPGRPAHHLETTENCV